MQWLHGLRSPAADHLDEAVVIRKVMALSRAEFLASMCHLVGSSVETDKTTLVVGRGSVRINYMPDTSRRLGGLLTLPSAVVTLTFLETAEKDRQEFLTRFDRVFQRGGG